MQLAVVKTGKTGEKVWVAEIFDCEIGTSEFDACCEAYNAGAIAAWDEK